MTVTKIFRREEAIRNFRKMWQWMAKEGIKRRKFIDKCEYLAEHNLEQMENDCYLCEYVVMTSLMLCHDCPIKWGEHNELCTDYNSLYYHWRNTVENSTKTIREVLKAAFLCVRISYLLTYHIEWEEVRKK